MEPIGELDSVQHPLLHVCAFRHFDVETVFLYPWAVAFHPRIVGVEAPDFVAILVIALVYTHGAKEPWNGHES